MLAIIPREFHTLILPLIAPITLLPFAFEENVKLVILKSVLVKNLTTLPPNFTKINFDFYYLPFEGIVLFR